MKIPTYYGGDVEVQLGDHVTIWGLCTLFRRKVGRIVYVPGVSKKNAELERDGLTWVGIRFGNCEMTADVVDPETGQLGKGTKFVKRDPVGYAEFSPDEEFE